VLRNSGQSADCDDSFKLNQMRSRAWDIGGNCAFNFVEVRVQSI
jgi:hypothetical protein